MIHVSQCFHMLLSIYALVIFSFYFIFKPFYIIMVLNWAFDSEFDLWSLSYELIIMVLNWAFYSEFDLWSLVSHRGLHHRQVDI